MKLVSFEVKGASGYGLVAGDRIRRMDTLSGAPADLKAALEAAWFASSPSFADAEEVALAEVKLLPPVPAPDKVFCIATNFHEPSREGKPLPEYPLVFTRFGDSFTGHERPLLMSRLTQKYDFEGELAVVIGKPAYKVPRERALEHIAGYSCLNDGSARDWQKHSTQFTPGKNFFRSGSMGPWLVTADEVPEIGALALETRVNGTVKQAIGMDCMIFDIPWLIAYLSSFTPLSPGDVIATGTPSGFGSSRNPPQFLAAGDVIEIEIPGVGLLRNTVSDEPAEGARE